MNGNTTYRLLLKPIPEPYDPLNERVDLRLRAALKRLLRDHGLQCLSIDVVPATAREQPATPKEVPT